MIQYSNSKFETFEQCRLKFKFKYIDKIVPEIEKTIESHLGDVVHRALEWLYVEKMKKITPTIGDLITYYAEVWEGNYNPEIIIVKKELSAEDYFNKGVEFLVNYYLKHHPFDDNTIATEKRIEINLDEKGEKKLIGYIDRLVHNLEKNEIEIHDYKTANNLPTKEKIENSRQLALYSIAIKEIFGKEKEVSLIWHFLAHDIKVRSKKTNEELELLKKEIIELINTIESAKDFPPTKSVLCNWCLYKTICPAWGNQPPKKRERQLSLTEIEQQEKIEELI